MLSLSPEYAVRLTAEPVLLSGAAAATDAQLSVGPLQVAISCPAYNPTAEFVTACAETVLVAGSELNSQSAPGESIRKSWSSKSSISIPEFGSYVGVGVGVGKPTQLCAFITVHRSVCG